VADTTEIPGGLRPGSREIAGLLSVILGNAIEGEARDVGIVHAGIARQCGDWGQPLEIPCVLISGGETNP